MSFLCFIETRSGRVPLMEALDADTLPLAQIEAHRRLQRHDSGVAAFIFDGDQHIATVMREPGAKLTLSRAANDQSAST